MVILSNIRMSARGIECDYDPEQKGAMGHIVLGRDESVEIERSPVDGRAIYAGMALQRMRKLLAQEGTIPQTDVVMWY